MRRRFGALLAATLFSVSAYLSPWAFGVASQRLKERTKLEEWEVEISEAEGAGQGLSASTQQRAARALNTTGFVVLRGASIFTEEELEIAQGVAEQELLKVKEVTKKIGLLERAPWIRGTYNIQKLFEFQEALCYSQGRLDMPKLLGLPELKSTQWCQHPDLQGITRRCFATPGAQQTVLGALWNFPGSGPPVWHRDGSDQLLVAVTAPKDYPETVGFIHGQPQTQLGAPRAMAAGPKSPDPTLGEMDVPLPLRRGETLLFFYSTKHAATPNLSDLERCLIYSVHGPLGVQDQQNHKDFLPSIFDLTREEAMKLDDFYQRQGYLMSSQGTKDPPSFGPFLLAVGLLVTVLACLALQR